MCVKFTDNAYHYFPPPSGRAGPRGDLEKAVYEGFYSNVGFDIVKDDRVVSKGGDTYQVPFLPFA